MNQTKFGSPHLDTPSSRYEFLKYVTKYMKINQEKHFKYRMTAGTHPSVTHRAGARIDRWQTR